MSNISTTATRTPYAVTNSTTGVSSSTPNNTVSSTTPATSSSTTPSVSTTPPQGADVANTQNTGTVSASTTSAYGNAAPNSSSKPVSSTTAPNSGASTNMVANTIERNGGYITIYTEGNTSTTSNMVPNTIERNGGYITIYTEGNASTTPSSSSTTPTGSSTTPSNVSNNPGNNVVQEEVGVSYSEIIESIDNQIRLLANDSVYKHEDPEAAKTKLKQLQELRLEVNLKASTSISNKISLDSTEINEFSFTKEEEKAFDLAAKEKIMDFIADEKYSWLQWMEYTMEEKKVLLENLSCFVSEQLGIPNKGIEFYYSKDEKSHGMYDYDSGKLLINEINLWQGGTNGPIHTVIHELRHAYQRYAVENPGLFVVSKETLKKWNDNYAVENYITHDNPGYREQPLEWDATNFAHDTYELSSINPDLVTYEGSWEK